MRIVQSVPGFFPASYGGGQVYVYHLTKELLRRGHDVAIISSAPWQDGSEECAVESYGFDGLCVKAIRLNPRFLSHGEVNSELAPVLMKSVENLLKQLNPDLVHLNGVKAATMTVCNGLNIPHVVSARHPGSACAAATPSTPERVL